MRTGCLKFFVFCFLLVLGVVVSSATATIALMNHFAEGLPDVTKLRAYEPSETTRIFAANGKQIATLYKENRSWTPLEDMSPYLLKAIVATEDSRFYTHHGVDLVGVGRAALYDVLHRGTHEGASTITMQLARNLFLSPEQDFERKIKEMLLALQIEKKFTKDEILELYLNQIYFGSGAYGVQQAAHTFYGKNAKDLTIAESALIAGLPQAPSDYNPLVDERAAHNRQILVLGRMQSSNYLTYPQYRKAIEDSRHPHYVKKKKAGFQEMEVPYFTTYLIHKLYEHFPEDLLYRGGLQIHTTVDLKLQHRAEQTVRSMIRTYGRGLHADSAALVCIENKTGFIRAMVGGLGWSKTSQFNRAWQSRRRPGSSFKMFVYSAAMEAGYTPDTMVDDSPVTVKVSPTESWSPKNDDHTFEGWISLRVALQQSRNVIAVKLLQMVGVQKIIALAYRMGMTDKLDPNPSLALGATGVNPLEMASAYTVLPNLGARNEIECVKSITDSANHTVEDHTFPRQEEVLSEITATMMTEMLQGVVARGTGTAARIPGVQVAGKTGTTDDYGDAWFVGYTPQYTTAVWVGNDNNAPMVNSFGGDLPARIWKTFMAAAQVDQPRIPFGMLNKGQIGVLMCSESGKRATNGCLKTIRKFYAPGSVPTVFCPLHARGHSTIPGGKHPAVSRPEDIPAPDDPLAEPPEEPSSTPTEPKAEHVPRAPDALPAPTTEGRFEAPKAASTSTPNDI
jgi:penicillin-binding protein 1A